MILLIVAAESRDIPGPRLRKISTTQYTEAQLGQPGDSLVVGVVLAQEKIVF